jgi:gas vesicle protein
MKKITFFLSIVGGIATGLLIGILFAPEKGSSTREKIARKGGELTEGIKIRFQQFGEFIEEKLDILPGFPASY